MTTATAYSPTPDNSSEDNLDTLCLAILSDTQPMMDGLFEGTECKLASIPITDAAPYDELQVTWPGSLLRVAVGVTTSYGSDDTGIDIVYYYTIYLGDDTIGYDVADSQTELIDELEQVITDLCETDMRVAIILANTSQDIYERENGFVHNAFMGQVNASALPRDCEYTFEGFADGTDEWVPPAPGYGGTGADWGADWGADPTPRMTDSDGIVSYYSADSCVWVAPNSRQEDMDDFYTAQDCGELPDWSWMGVGYD